MKPIRFLALDIRAHSINAIVAIKTGTTLETERAVMINTLGFSDALAQIGTALVKSLDAKGLPTVTAIDPKSVATSSVHIESFIKACDYDGVATRHGLRLPRPTRNTRRIRWRKSSAEHLTLSVADDKAVNDRSALLQSFGCKPWVIADPALVWLETYAPDGIIDDLDGTTLFAAPASDGTIRNDIIAHDTDAKSIVTATTQSIRSETIKNPIAKLAYFGPADRFAMLRASLAGISIELLPALAPHRTATASWTFAHALASFGATQ